MSLTAAINPIVALMSSRELQSADQGNYFVATTPTPGTGIISSGSVQAYTLTTPYLVLFNNGPFNVYPTFMRTCVSVVDVTASAATFYTFSYNAGNQVTSGGTALTINNTNSGSAISSGVTATVGAITAPGGAGGNKVTSHSKIRSLTVQVIHDSVTINWGHSSQSLLSTLINNTTTHSDVVFNVAPVVITPGNSLVMVRWSNSGTTGVTNEFELGFIAK